MRKKARQTNDNRAKGEKTKNAKENKRNSEKQRKTNNYDEQDNNLRQTPRSKEIKKEKKTQEKCFVCQTRCILRKVSAVNGINQIGD